MPYDGIFIHFLVSELRTELLGSKVNKISETDTLDIILQMRFKGVNKHLLISTSLDMPRLYLTSHKVESVDVPKNFCMVLRKYLDRSILEDILQFTNDRIIIFKFSSTSELGDNLEYRLIVELMGRNSNIILVNNDNIIIDAMRKLPPSDTVTRIILPKAIYQYPICKTTLNPFLVDRDFNDLEALQGVSKGFLSHLNNHNLNLYDYLRSPLECAIYKFDNKYDFYLLPLEKQNIVEANFSTICSMLDTFYQKYRHIDTDKAKDLKRVVKNKIIHLQNKIDNLTLDLKVANDNLKYNDLGILLQANLYKVKKGMDHITVEDYNNENREVSITLDPTLDPSINLKKIFTKGKKAKNALIMINEQLQLTNEEISYLDNIYTQITFANKNDLDEIRVELVKNKYLKDTKMTKPKTKKITITKYLFNGNTIMVGKNNLQNDYLTHHLASKNDWWFHVKDMPGAHVVFKVPLSTYNLTEDDIRYCANLASSFSKAHRSSSVPVDYVQVRYLKKIPKTKGYEVIYTNQKTIYIDPNL